MRDHGNNLYPSTTDHRAHLKGIERAEAYLIDRQQQKIHKAARQITIACIVVLIVCYAIGGLS